MNEPGKTIRRSTSSPRRFGGDGTAGWGGDRRTQRVSHKLPKTRGVRLLFPLPESVMDAYGIGCFGPDHSHPPAPAADANLRLDGWLLPLVARLPMGTPFAE